MLSQAQQSESRRKEADEELVNEEKKLKQLKMESGGMSSDDIVFVKERINTAHRDIQNDLNNLGKDLRDQLEKHSLDSQRAIESVRQLAESNRKNLATINKEISDLEETINLQAHEFAKKINDDRKQALYYYDQLLCNTEKISGLYPEKYEALFPDRLHVSFNVLKKTIDDVAEDIKHNRFESAIGLVQTRLQESVNYLIQLEAYNAAFLKTKNVVVEGQLRVLETLEQIEKEKKTTICINDTEYIDCHGMPYWVREMYKIMKEHFEETSRLMKISIDAYDNKGLIDISNDLKNIEAQLSVGRLIEENERKLHYDCCEQLAQIYDAINENDNGKWKVENNSINEEDLRGPIQIVLSCQEGIRLNIACIPERNVDPKVYVKSRCRIEVFDKGETKEDLSRCEIIYNNIVTILAGHGIAIELNKKSDLIDYDSNELIERTIANEQIMRKEWLEQSKKTLRL